MKCDLCFSKFDAEKQPGALMFGPPEVIRPRQPPLAQKFHVCQNCWKNIWMWLNGLPTKRLVDASSTD